MTNKEVIEHLEFTKNDILSESFTENEIRDFKRKYSIGKTKTKERAEFLKDVIAFANSNGSNEALIFFGIDELRENGKKTGKFKIIGIDENEQISIDDMKNIIKDSIYPIIHCDVLTVKNNSLKKTIQILKLDSNTDRPYMLRQSVLNGTHYIESSKYYRQMHSSVRIPCTEEDRLFSKWKKEDFYSFLGNSQHFEYDDSKKSEIELELLDKIKSAYNNELEKIKKNHKPNGIKLQYLAEVSVNQEGNYDAAIESLISLIRLSSAQEARGNEQILFPPTPERTPFISAMKLLKLFIETDYFSLFHQSIRLLRFHALLGDYSNSKLSNYEIIPSPSFNSITSIFYYSCFEFEKEGNAFAKDLVNILIDLLLSIGVVLNDRNIKIPKASDLIYVDMMCLDPGVIKNQKDDLLPFIKLSYKIARLSENLFQHAISYCKYKCGINTIFLDANEGDDKELSLEYIRRWAVIPNDGFTALKVKNQKDLNECQYVLNKVNEKGDSIAINVRDYLKAARSILIEYYQNKKNG